MPPFLALLAALPQLAGLLLPALHSIIVLVETAFPNASGAQKLDNAVGLVTGLVPQLSASTEALKPIISAVVALSNQTGGALAAMKAAAPAAAPVFPAVLDAMPVPAVHQDSAQG